MTGGTGTGGVATNGMPVWIAGRGRLGVVVGAVRGPARTTYAAAGCGAAGCPPLATLDMPGDVSFGAEPVVVNGRVFVALDDATLVAFEPPAAA
jgi:hypothetical protein